MIINFLAEHTLVFDSTEAGLCTEATYGSWVPSVAFNVGLSAPRSLWGAVESVQAQLLLAVTAPRPPDSIASYLRAGC